jgi:hypothetical protein
MDPKTIEEAVLHVAQYNETTNDQETEESWDRWKGRRGSACQMKSKSAGAK